MADHDHSYKLLFAHPQMVRDLLEGFVGGGWLGQLDFSTLERVSGSYVSDDLRARADDIVWRVRCGEHYVYLLIEFQSSVESFMAVRVLTYVGLLYQDLLRAGEMQSDGRLPPILPIVLYNGSSRWRAAEELASLMRDAPSDLEKYCPQLRYLLIDEGSYEDHELASLRNLVAILFRLENCRRHDQINEIVSTLVEWLSNANQDSLRRAFSVWLGRVILARLSDGCVSGVGNLWEMRTMLAERFDQWEAEFRQEGEAMLLTRLLQRRFGELPASVRARLRNAQPDLLEQWGERLLEGVSLNELFSDEAVTASESRAR